MSISLTLSQPYNREKRMRELPVKANLRAWTSLPINQTDLSQNLCCKGLEIIPLPMVSNS